MEPYTTITFYRLGTTTPVTTEFTLNGTNYSNAATYQLERGTSKYTDEQLNITTTPTLTETYPELNITIERNNASQTFYHTPYKLSLQFYDYYAGGITQQTNVFLYSLSGIMNFTNTNTTTIYLEDLPQELITVAFGKYVANGTLTDTTQKYQFYNTEYTTINKPIEVLVLENTTSEQKIFRVTDTDGVALQGALVQFTQARWNNSIWSSATFEEGVTIGQYVTDDDGYITANFDHDRAITYLVTKEGYANAEVSIGTIEEQTFGDTLTTPIEIKLGRSITTTNRTTLWYAPFTNTSRNLPILIHQFDAKHLAYRTNYSATQGIEYTTFDDTSRSKNLKSGELIKNIHFNSSTTNNITLYIYQRTYSVDPWTKIATWNIPYNGKSQTAINNPNAITQNETYVVAIGAIALLFISMLVGLILRKSPTAGKNTFIYGGIILPIFIGTGYALTIIGTIYLFMNIINRMMGD